MTLHPSNTTAAERPPNAAAQSLDDPRVVEVVEEYLRDCERGHAADRKHYVNRYPELAGAISECLEGLDLVQAGKASGAAPRGGSREAAHLAEGLASPLGDFQIVGELARGGMGIVYEAVQLSLGRRVALKVLPFSATFDARQLQRFKNEAQAAALLHHTNIVPIFAVGCDRGVHYYAMQLIEGQSLSAVIGELRHKAGRASERGGEPGSASEQAPSSECLELLVPEGPAEAGPAKSGAASNGARRSTVEVSVALTAGGAATGEAYIRRVARLMVQAADALEHAHAEGVVHRDIKPANLLVDSAGKLWITDFGLAHLQNGHTLTRSGDLLGTFRYMSPEQAGGSRTLLDHRTDIYSLGATFYELLTLESAVAGETHQQLLFNILHAEPRSLREHNRAIPAELETIVLKALSKAPAERYRTAAEFGADVERFLEHRPILARRPTPLERLRKWTRRHPGVVAAAVLLLLVVAAASLFSAWAVSVEKRETEAALAREQLRAAEAEARFRQARAAVDALFEISEEDLADRPFDGARRRILQVVLSHYEDFIEQREGDSVSQAELARVQEKVKGILRELDLLRRELDVRLLGNPGVQRDLGLSDRQREELAALQNEWFEESSAMFARFGGVSEEQRRRQMVGMAERREAQLDRLLTAAQRQRLRQIGVQSQGLFAFKEPEVAAELRLTSEQRSQLRELEREMLAARFRPGGPGEPRNFGRPPGGEPFPPGRPPPEREHRRPPPPHFGRFGAGPDEWVGRALDLLSSEQRDAWRELVGEPFVEQEHEPFFGHPLTPTRPKPEP